jgi:hypothetical protein
LFLFFLRTMVPNGATNRSARQPMMTCHMARDSADGSALDATTGTRADGQHGYR